MTNKTTKKIGDNIVTLSGDTRLVIGENIFDTKEDVQELFYFLKDWNNSSITRSKQIIVSGFPTYDTSKGHCGLCGCLGCNGGCFK